MENNNAKNMKKFRKPLVIVAMVLMVALVCGMGAMTYSRYISTTDVPAQTATAAKWGFVVTATTDNLFATDYTLGSGATHATKVADNGVAVNAANITLAPGTSGYLLISVEGEAEVRARLSIVIDITKELGYDNGGTGDYYPIKWALSDSADTPTSGWKSSDDLGTSLVGADIEAGEAPAQTAYYLHWCWDFETGADSDEKLANNRHDTIIGAKANNPSLVEVNKVLGAAPTTQEELDKYNETLTFSVSATIEQIQE